MEMNQLLRQPLFFEPAFKQRVWGGQQLKASDTDTPIGEAWVLHEEQAVRGGPLAGLTLAELTRLYPRELLGEHWRGTRFPLLIKLLDCQAWLSVQVHPDDGQARRMVGPLELGKTEAWHILNAATGATIISGTRAGVRAEELRQAILSGTVMPLTHQQAVQAGETYLVPAGTLHAIGPGLLIYEVQQTSDTTYRVYDWDRPASAGRELHLNQSAEVSRPGQAARTPAPQGDGTHLLTKSDYFVLEELRGPQKASTQGKPHLLTVKDGQATLHTAAGEAHLLRHETVLLPASLGEYTLTGNFSVLRASLP